MKKPSRPNQKSVQTSKVELWSAKDADRRERQDHRSQHVHADLGHQHEDAQHHGLHAEHDEIGDEEGDEDRIGEHRLFGDEGRAGHDIVDQERAQHDRRGDVAWDAERHERRKRTALDRIV